MQNIHYSKINEITQLLVSLPFMNGGNRPYDNVRLYFLEKCIKYKTKIEVLKDVENKKYKDFLEKNPGELYLISISSEKVTSFVEDLRRYN